MSHLITDQRLATIAEHPNRATLHEIRELASRLLASRDAIRISTTAGFDRDALTSALVEETLAVTPATGASSCHQ